MEIYGELLEATKIYASYEIIYLKLEKQEKGILGLCLANIRSEQKISSREAELLAYNKKEYQEHIDKLTNAKYNMIVAKGTVDAVKMKFDEWKTKQMLQMSKDKHTGGQYGS